jgi:DNA-binding beta-propeller fold protein YncE
MHKLFKAAFLLSLSALSTYAQPPATVQQAGTISLPEVMGKFDHFAIDESGKRLFAAATGNHAVVVVDLATGKILQMISGLGKPHGVAWIPETGSLFVADGDKADLDIFRGSPLKLIKSIKLSEDADDMVYDAAEKILYVGHGGTDAANPSAVAVVDVTGLSLIKDIAMASHPEALEIDAKHDRIFVNVSDTGEIVVIDGKTQTIDYTWKLQGEKGNTPLAFDAAGDLLLVGCRTPAKLLVLNAKTGEQIAALPSDSGADDLFYEPSTHRAYLITGSGSVDSYSVSSDGKVEAISVSKTVSGAKTGLLVPSEEKLYIGIPGTSGPSEIRIYKTSGK